MQAEIHDEPEDRFVTTINDLANILIREANKQPRMAVVGVILDASDKAEHPVRLFSNVTEQGADLAELFREIAKMIDEKTKQGRIVVEHTRED